MPEASPFLARERYRLIDVLGQGGMATVYRAYDSVLDVTRAIKVLAPEYSSHERVRERFLLEARTTARLHHSNIVTLHDMGADEDRVFIVMELVLGGSLRDRVDLHGPLPPRLACNAMIHSLNALHFAHENGVIHRDVKPHNILVTHENRPKITDFGIAHVSNTNRNLTRTGAMMGTLAYMAPEQQTSARRVDARSDVYAATATMYHLLTGREPENLFVDAAKRQAYADVPDFLAEILWKGTEFDPAARYGSASAMAAVLAKLVDELPPDPIGTLGLAIKAGEFRSDPTAESLPIKDPRELAAFSLVDKPGPGTFINETPIPVLSEHELPENMDDDYIDVTAHNVRRSAPMHTEGDFYLSEPTSERNAHGRAGPPWAWIVGTVALMVVLGAGAASFGAFSTEPGPAPVASPGPAVVTPLVAPEAAPVMPSTVQPSPRPLPETIVSKPTPMLALPPAPAPASAPAPQPASTPEPEPEPDPEPAPVIAPAPTLPPSGPTGILSVEADGGGKITVDGKVVGSGKWQGKVSVGPHTVVIVGNEGTTHTQRIPVFLNRTARLCWDVAAGAACP
jgi:serine/threonine protein kinase